MKNIIQNGDPILREKAKEVPPAEIKSARIKKILKDMHAALLSQDDGVALAAPQIGISLRIFIVSKAIFLPPAELKKRAEIENHTELKRNARYLAFINPILTKLSRQKEELEEGCLSVRPLYGKIKRSKKATIEAYDENGIWLTRGASGILAQIFQHECEHLDGILFIDKATGLRTLPVLNQES